MVIEFCRSHKQIISNIYYTAQGLLHACVSGLQSCTIFAHTNHKPSDASATSLNLHRENNAHDVDFHLAGRHITISICILQGPESLSKNFTLGAQRLRNIIVPSVAVPAQFCKCGPEPGQVAGASGSNKS